MADNSLIASCLQELRSEFVGPSNTEELLACLKETIPLVDAEYKVISITGTDKQYKGTLKCKLGGVQAVEVFVKSYMERTNETL